MSTPLWSFSGVDASTDPVTREEEQRLFQAMPPSHCRIAWQMWKKGKSPETEAILPWSWWLISSERDHLIRANVRLLFMLVRGRADSAELASHLFPWLIWSVDRFDPSRHFKLSTYVVWTLRCQIKNFYYWRMPPKSERLKSGAKDRRKPKMEHLWDDLSLYPMEEVFADYRASDDSEPEAEATIVVDALNILDERSRFVIVNRFGIGTEPKTLETVGAMVGITKERARQLESRAIANMRNAIGATSLGEVG